MTGHTTEAMRDDDFYAVLRRAHKAQRTVSITYEAESSDSGITTREVDVYELGHGYFCGFCHLRNDARMFKVSRIHAIELTDRTFQVRDRIRSALRESDFRYLLMGEAPSPPPSPDNTSDRVSHSPGGPVSSPSPPSALPPPANASDHLVVVAVAVIGVLIACMIGLTIVEALAQP